MKSEYSELEETRGDHQVHLLAPHSTTQNSNIMSETTVQTLLELWHNWCYDQCPGEPVSVHNHSFGKKPFPNIQHQTVQLHVIPLGLTEFFLPMLSF